jgi:hypothetical protein
MLGFSRSERVWLPLAGLGFLIVLVTNAGAQISAVLTCGKPFSGMNLFSGVRFLLTQSVETAFGSVRVSRFCDEHLGGLQFSLSS